MAVGIHHAAQRLVGKYGIALGKVHHRLEMHLHVGRQIAQQPRVTLLRVKSVERQHVCQRPGGMDGFAILQQQDVGFRQGARRHMCDQQVQVAHQLRMILVGDGVDIAFEIIQRQPQQWEVGRQFARYADVEFHDRRICYSPDIPCKACASPAIRMNAINLL